MKKFSMTLCAILCAICAITAQNKPTGVFMNLYAKDMAQPHAISENGKWACGSATQEDATTINASKWNLETGERIYLSNDETEPCDARCINNDGTIVGGSYNGQPAYWLEKDQLWHEVEMPRGYTSASGDIMAMAFVNGDTIMIGYLFKSETEGKIVRWINGKEDTNFKYRNYTRYKEILNKEIPAQMEKLRGMSSDAQRYLISLDYNLLPTAGNSNLPTTFVQIGDTENYTTTVIEREFGNYDLVSFVEDATMSHNGKFVCGRIFGVPREGIDAKNAPAIAFTYDVDNNIFTHYNYIEQTQKFSAASCIDNEGRVYFKSVNGQDPLGKPYIYHNDQYIELESVLLQYEGITAEQIDAIAEEVVGSDADDLGMVWCVSGDGKTLIGAGDALKGNIWCAKLSCSPYDLVAGNAGTGTDNITYNNLAAYYSNGVITIEGVAADMIEVYSITGAKVMSQVVENSTIKADLNNGIYVVKVYNGENVATSKIIVK